MVKLSDSFRNIIRLTHDGRVIKKYYGPDGPLRFENEIKILRFLESKGCDFVPTLIEVDSNNFLITINNCGVRARGLTPELVKQLFSELEKYGVRHDDQDIRNIVYNREKNKHYIIDFELATII